MKNIMKKIIAFVMVMTMLASCLCITSFAAEADGIYFETTLDVKDLNLYKHTIGGGGFYNSDFVTDGERKVLKSASDVTSVLIQLPTAIKKGTKFAVEFEVRGETASSNSFYLRLSDTGDTHKTDDGNGGNVAMSPPTTSYRKYRMLVDGNTGLVKKYVEGNTMYESTFASANLTNLTDIKYIRLQQAGTVKYFDNITVRALTRAEIEEFEKPYCSSTAEQSITNQAPEFNLTTSIPQGGKATVEFDAKAGDSGDASYNVTVRFHDGTAYTKDGIINVPITGGDFKHYAVDMDFSTGEAKLYKEGMFVKAYTGFNLNSSGNAIGAASKLRLQYWTSTPALKLKNLKVCKTPTRVTEVKYSSGGTTWAESADAVGGITKAVSFKFNNAISSADAINAAITPAVADITKSYDAATQTFTLTSALGFAADTDYTITLSGYDTNAEPVANYSVSFTTADLKAINTYFENNMNEEKLGIITGRTGEITWSWRTTDNFKAYTSGAMSGTCLNFTEDIVYFKLDKSIPAGECATVEFYAMTTPDTTNTLNVRFYDENKHTGQDLNVKIDDVMALYKIEADLETGVAAIYKNGVKQGTDTFTLNGITSPTRMRIESNDGELFIEDVSVYKTEGKVTEVTYSNGTAISGKPLELGGVIKSVSLRLSNDIANADAVTVTVTPAVADIVKTYDADNRAVVLTSAAGFAQGTEYTITLNGRDTYGYDISYVNVFTTGNGFGVAISSLTEDKFLTGETATAEFIIDNPVSSNGKIDLIVAAYNGNRLVDCSIKTIDRTGILAGKEETVDLVLTEDADKIKAFAWKDNMCPVIGEVTKNK